MSKSLLWYGLTLIIASMLSLIAGAIVYGADVYGADTVFTVFLCVAMILFVIGNVITIISLIKNKKE